MTKRLEIARRALDALDMTEQVSLLTSYFGEGHSRQSDAFHDALMPVSAAWDEAFCELDAAAEYDPSENASGRDEDQFWRESAYAIKQGFGE
jgi:hypothetical protein